MCCLLLAACAHAQAPVADFSGAPLVGAPTLSVSFTDASTGSPTSWDWDFGDSSSSTSQNPSHSYTSAGSYMVSLTVANASGEDTEVKPDYVTVTTGRIVNVSTGQELDDAVWNALDGDTIVVADGTYEDADGQEPYLRLENKNDIVIRGASGDPTAVTVLGNGWDRNVRNDDALWLWGSQNVIVSHMTFAECADNGIKMLNTLRNGETLSNITISHCNFMNCGARAVKGTGGDMIPVQTGSITYCNFENTKVPPRQWYDQGNYIAGIDCMVLKNWTISDNTFKNIQGRTGGGRAAIFTWVECENVVVERNVIVGCDRGIAFGNPSYSDQSPTQHHMTNGVIRNNFIGSGWDKRIELCWINGAKVYHNTLLTGDSLEGIHYHWEELLGIHIANNIVRGDIYGDPGDVTVENNITSGILDSWFEDVATGDFHLTSLATPAIDQVDRLADCVEDIDEETRPTAAGMCDVGGDERFFVPVAPTADFSGNPTQGPPTLTVLFTDLSSGSPTSWDWDFGDTGSSTAQHPSHDYTTENLYTVSLTATNAQGQDTETKVDYIDVSTGPTQSCHVGAIDMFSAGPPNYKGGATITIHDQDCQPLDGVTVNIEWSGATSSTDSDVTDLNGQVTFESDKNRNGGTFICTVTSLSKTGYPYESGDNHETSDQITLP
jgi:PKD repeat protein